MQGFYDSNEFPNQQSQEKFLHIRKPTFGSLMVLIFKHLKCDFFIDKNIANTGQFDLFLYLNIDYYKNYTIQLNGSFKDFLFKFLLKIGSSQAIQFQPLIGYKFWPFGSTNLAQVFSWLF